jgi:hypothetical protein
MKGTIAAAFASYRQHVIPAGAGPEQIIETERAFYAGAGLLLEILLGPALRLPDDESTELMVALVTEVRSFVKSVGETAARPH